jgi:uncharacterized protein YbaR (Trm112 family)
MTTQKCPHCKGELVVAPQFVYWHYECERCGRAWFVVDNLWFALFDAEGHVYCRTDGKFERISNHTEIKKLWEEVEKRLL